MATNKPESRRTHITRIFGTNRDGEILTHIWADVERIDWMQYRASGDGDRDGQYVGTGRKLRWGDDPSGDDYDPEDLSSRKKVVVKVCDPNSDDIDNPDEWIPIRAIRRMQSVQSRENYMGTGESHLNDAENNDAVAGRARKVETRRIVHYDTNIDKQAKAAAESGQAAYVVSSDDYFKDEGTKDDGQYVEHEIVKSYYTGGNVVRRGLSGNQGRLVKMLNQYLIDENEVAKLEEVGQSGINPPYRLDPFQNIINVKFKTLYLIVEVSAGNGIGAFGPTGSGGSAGPPSASAKPNNDSVKELDVEGPHSASNTVYPSGCFVHPIGWSGSAYWVHLFNESPGNWQTYASDNGVCSDPGPDHGVIGVNGGSGASIGTTYLYKISAGDDLILVNISGLLSNSPNNNAPISTSTSGGGTIVMYVYSTVKDKVEKLSDLRPEEDGPTEDSSIHVTLTSKNAGTVKVSVALNKEKEQTDNYGKKYNPYVISVDRSPDVAIVSYPSQPPPRLDL